MNHCEEPLLLWCASTCSWSVCNCWMWRNKKPSQYYQLLVKCDSSIHQTWNLLHTITCFFSFFSESFRVNKSRFFFFEKLVKLFFSGHNQKSFLFLIHFSLLVAVISVCMCKESFYISTRDDCPKNKCLWLSDQRLSFLHPESNSSQLCRVL